MQEDMGVELHVNENGVSAEHMHALSSVINAEAHVCIARVHIDWQAPSMGRVAGARVGAIVKAAARQGGMEHSEATLKWRLKNKCITARKSAFAAVCKDRRRLKLLHSSVWKLYRRCKDAHYAHDAATRHGLRRAITLLVEEPEIDDYWARANEAHRHLTMRLEL